MARNRTDRQTEAPSSSQPGQGYVNDYISGRQVRATPQEVEPLLQRPDVNLAHIATPPFLRHPQALLALRAGKHVICEKPPPIDATRTASMGANP